MTTVYLETSALLTWLFNERESNRVRKVLEESERCVTSVLTIVEAERVFRRVLTRGHFTTVDYQKLRGLFLELQQQWVFIEITRSIRTRAGESFPVEPVGILDAIHLASMLEFHLIYRELAVLSFDQRIRENLVPLGFHTI